MEQNPQIMMELMPPTPGKKQQISAEKLVEIEQIMNQTNQLEEERLQLPDQNAIHVSSASRTRSPDNSASPMNPQFLQAPQDENALATQLPNYRVIKHSSNINRPATSTTPLTNQFRNSRTTKNSTTNLKLQRPSTTTGQKRPLNFQTQGLNKQSQNLIQGYSANNPTRQMSAFTSGIDSALVGSGISNKALYTQSNSQNQTQDYLNNLASQSEQQSKWNLNNKNRRSRSNYQRVNFQKTQQAYNNERILQQNLSVKQRRKLDQAAGRISSAGGQQNNMRMPPYYTKGDGQIFQVNKVNRLFRNLPTDGKSFEPVIQKTQSECVNQQEFTTDYQMTENQYLTEHQYNKQGDDPIQIFDNTQQQINFDHISSSDICHDARTVDEITEENVEGGEQHEEPQTDKPNGQALGPAARSRSATHTTKPTNVNSMSNLNQIENQVLRPRASSGIPRARFNRNQDPNFKSFQKQKLMDALKMEQKINLNNDVGAAYDPNLDYSFIPNSQSHALLINTNQNGANNRNGAVLVTNQPGNNSSMAALNMYAQKQLPANAAANQRAKQQKANKKARNQALQQWPRVDLDESQKMLYGALKDISKVNSHVVRNIKKNQQFYHQSQPVNRVGSADYQGANDNILMRMESPTSEPKIFDRLDRNLMKKLQPQAIPFMDFTSQKGIKESSVARLNPLKLSQANKDYMKKKESNNSRSPQSPASKSKSIPQKNSLKHEKRLEKLQKLRKSIKTHGEKSKSPPQPTCNYHNYNKIVSIKKKQKSPPKNSLKNKDSGPPINVETNDYKIISTKNSILDMKNKESNKDFSSENDYDERKKSHVSDIRQKAAPKKPIVTIEAHSSSMARNSSNLTHGSFCSAKSRGSQIRGQGAGPAPRPPSRNLARPPKERMKSQDSKKSKKSGEKVKSPSNKRQELSPQSEERQMPSEPSERARQEMRDYKQYNLDNGLQAPTERDVQQEKNFVEGKTTKKETARQRPSTVKNTRGVARMTKTEQRFQTQSFDDKIDNLCKGSYKTDEQLLSTNQHPQASEKMKQIGENLYFEEVSEGSSDTHQTVNYQLGAEPAKSSKQPDSKKNSHNGSSDAKQYFEKIVKGIIHSQTGLVVSTDHPIDAIPLEAKRAKRKVLKPVYNQLPLSQKAIRHQSTGRRDSCQAITKSLDPSSQTPFSSAAPFRPVAPTTTKKEQSLFDSAGYRKQDTHLRAGLIYERRIEEKNDSQTQDSYSETNQSQLQRVWDPRKSPFTAKASPITAHFKGSMIDKEEIQKKETVLPQPSPDARRTIEHRMEDYDKNLQHEEVESFTHRPKEEDVQEEGAEGLPDLRKRKEPHIRMASDQPGISLAGLDSSVLNEQIAASLNMIKQMSWDDAADGPWKELFTKAQEQPSIVVLPLPIAAPQPPGPKVRQPQPSQGSAIKPAEAIPGGVEPVWDESRFRLAEPSQPPQTNLGDETPRTRYKRSLKEMDLVKQRAAEREIMLSKDDVPSVANLKEKFEWDKTLLFRQCLRQKRFTTYKIYDKREVAIMNHISNLRNNPEGNKQAHILLPIFEETMSFLEELLCTELGIDHLFHRIKKSYKAIDHQSTLKLLVRAKLCAQMKEDIAVLISKYLDFMEALRQVQQLRDENATDQLIITQVRKLQKHGLALLQRCSKYKIDHTRIFKEGNIWVGGKDVVKQVEEIMATFDLLFEEYQAPKKDKQIDAGS